MRGIKFDRERSMDESESTNLAECEIRATRLLEAPRELVFKVWTEAHHLEQWWGPYGFRTTTRRADIKAGGQWRFVMQGPDGTDYENLITFREIDAPRRIAYEHGATDDEDPVDFHVEVDFAPREARTHLSMRMRFASNAVRDRVVEKYGAFEGLKEALARLRDHILKQVVPVAAPAFDAQR